MSSFRILLLSFPLLSSSSTCDAAFSPSFTRKRIRSLTHEKIKLEIGPFTLLGATHRIPSHLHSSTTTEATPASSFIDTELRGAAMKLHTKKQAPKEGQAEETEPFEPYVTTLADYLAFLVDSQHVYKVLEEIVDENTELVEFRSTGMERTVPLETDILHMMEKYNLARPEVGSYGLSYETKLRNLFDQKGGGIPSFMCHYYNFYFAHTAGGRMIGKKMSSLLLDNVTLNFYKWDGNLNEIKAKVKGNIEAMVSTWTREEKDLCVAETSDAFRYGGGINAYLGGKR